MATFEEIKAKLLAQKSRQNGERPVSNSGDNASYPFWNINTGSQAAVRFLPDGDESNTFFWAERQVIRLPFQGVVGGDYPTDKPVTVTVPCVQMFNQTCPITAATKPWWKGDDEQKALARVYWKKKSYIFQGFVVNSPFEEQNLPENPIRRFVINSSIFEIIRESLVNPEMEDLPIDYLGGRDFNIKKTQKGEWANYGTSSWAMKQRSLNESELAAIQKHGLFNLSDFLGRIPDADELDAIKAMFELSVAGEPYDMEAFGKWFRPYGARGGDDAADAASVTARTASKTTAAPAAVAQTVTEEAAPAATAGAKPDPQDILARIRARTQGK